MNAPRGRLLPYSFRQRSPMNALSGNATSQTGARSVACVALLRGTRTVQGRTYVDAYDPRTGQGWADVPVVVNAGGGSTRWASSPIANVPQEQETPLGAPATEAPNPDLYDSAQVLLMFVSASVFPVCVGVIQHPKTGIKDKVEASEVTDDRSADVSTQDFAWKQGESLFVFDEYGTMALLSAAGQKFSVQLGEDSLVRISYNNEAGERVLLANATKTYFGEFESAYDSATARLDALENKLTEVVNLLIPGVPTTGGDITVAQPQLVFVPPAAVDRPTADDTLVSSKVHLSSESEGA